MRILSIFFSLLAVAGCKTSSNASMTLDNGSQIPAITPQKTSAGSIDFVEEIPSLYVVCGDQNGDETEGCSPDGSRLAGSTAIFFANESGQQGQPDIQTYTDTNGLNRFKVVKRGSDYEYLYKYAMTSSGNLITTKVLQYHNQTPLCKDVKKMIDPDYDETNDPQASRKCKVLWNTRLVGQYGIFVTMLKPGSRPQVVEDTFNNLPQTDVASARLRNSSIAKDLTRVQSGGHTVADLLVDFYNAMHPNTTQMKGCLHNSRTRGYEDIQAYVYCMVPHNERKRCFGKRINDYRMTCPIGTAPDFSEAFDHCFVGLNGNPPVMPLSNFELTGANAWHADLFKAAFDVIPAVNDYSVTSTEKVLDEFFTRVNLVRQKNTKLRRVLDPDFGWIPNQPRYEELRRKQAAYMQKEKATNAPLFNSLSKPKIVCSPTFIDQVDGQVTTETAQQLQGFTNQ